MNLIYNYWYFPSALPINMCDNIIKTGKAARFNKATTGTNKRATAEVQKKKIKCILVK